MHTHTKDKLIRKDKQGRTITCWVKKSVPTTLSCSTNFIPALFEHEFVDYLKRSICMIKWALCYSPKNTLKSLTDICMMKWVAVVHDVSNSSHELTHSFHEATFHTNLNTTVKQVVSFLCLFFYQTKIKGKKRKEKREMLPP